MKENEGEGRVPVRHDDEVPLPRSPTTAGTAEFFSFRHQRSDPDDLGHSFSMSDAGSFLPDYVEKQILDK
jgi:hypothetical protein